MDAKETTRWTRNDSGTSRCVVNAFPMHACWLARMSESIITTTWSCSIVTYTGCRCGLKRGVMLVDSMRFTLCRLGHRPRQGYALAVSILDWLLISRQLTAKVFSERGFLATQAGHTCRRNITQHHRLETRRLDQQRF